MYSYQMNLISTDAYGRFFLVFIIWLGFASEFLLASCSSLFMIGG